MSDTEMDEITADQRDGVLRLVISRPERKNALTPSMAQYLEQQIQRANAGNEVGCIVLSGAGDAYSSGADLDVSMPARGDNPLRRHVFGLPLVNLLAEVAHSRVPIVSVVTGWALGGGMGLAAASTFVVAGRGSAVFGLPEAGLGVFPVPILPFISARTGTQKAFYWALTGQRVSADEAHAAGMADVVADPDQVPAEVDTLVGRLLDRDPLVIRAGWEWLTAARSGQDDLVSRALLLAHVYAAGGEADVWPGRGSSTSVPPP